MSLEYLIYSNSGNGDEIDYSSPVATVSALTFETPAIGLSEDWRWAVRVHDTVSGLTELNIDAIVRVVTDAAGLDITARPNPPTNLSALPTAAGGARVSWSYNPNGQGGAPTGFRVYVGTPTVSYATPAATVPFVPGRPTYSADLSGLADDTAYEVAVRAYNATAAEPNIVIATVTARTAGPDAVESLTAAAVA